MSLYAGGAPYSSEYGFSASPLSYSGPQYAPPTGMLATPTQAMQYTAAPSSPNSIYGMQGGGGVQVSVSKSPPVDEKTLLAPWYVGLNASQDKTALIKELQSTGSVGEFFVTPHGQKQHILIVKTSHKDVQSFAIDCHMVGNFQGFSVRGAGKSFITIYDMIRHYIKNKRTALPVQLVVKTAPLRSPPKSKPASALATSPAKPKEWRDNTYDDTSTKLRKWTRQLTAHKQATARAGNSDALPPLTFAHEDDTVAVSATYMKGIIGDNRGLEQRYAIERAHVEKVKGEVVEASERVEQLEKQLEQQVLRNELMESQHVQEMEDFQKQLEAIKKGYQLQLEATKEDAQADLSAEQQRLEQQMETLQVQTKDTQLEEREKAAEMLQQEREEADERIRSIENQLQTEKSNTEPLLKELYEQRQNLREEVKVLQAKLEEEQTSHTTEINALHAAMHRLRSEYAVELTRAREDVEVEAERARLLSDERRRLQQQLIKYSQGGKGAASPSGDTFEGFESDLDLSDDVARTQQKGTEVEADALSLFDDTASEGHGPEDAQDDWHVAVMAGKTPDLKLSNAQRHLELLRQQEAEVANRLDEAIRAAQGL